MTPYFINREGNNAVQELFVFDDYIVSLTVHGVCTAYSKCNYFFVNSAVATKETHIINLNEREKIRSIFMNNLNDSIFVVSVKEKSDCSRMKCRSLPIK